MNSAGFCVNNDLRQGGFLSSKLSSAWKIPTNYPSGIIIFVIITIFMINMRITKEGKMAELELLEQAILANSMTEVECRLPQ